MEVHNNNFARSNFLSSNYPHFSGTVPIFRFLGRKHRPGRLSVHSGKPDASPEKETTQLPDFPKIDLSISMIRSISCGRLSKIEFTFSSEIPYLLRSSPAAFADS